MLHRLSNDFRLVELFLANALINTNDVLPYDTSGTDIQVALSLKLIIN
jgi:hypothetical protein